MDYLSTIYGRLKGNRTSPRKLHALFVKDLDGNPIDWNLQKRFSIGERLPPLGQEGKGGEALGTFLKRRKYWKQLKDIRESINALEGGKVVDI